MTRPETEESLVPIILDYSLATGKLVRTVKENFYEETEKAGILKNHKIIAAYKRGKNLRDYLVNAKLPLFIEKEKRNRSKTFETATDR